MSALLPFVGSLLPSIWHQILEDCLDNASGTDLLHIPDLKDILVSRELALSIYQLAMATI